MTDIIERPKVGVGVIIMKDGKFLLGKRKNAHGEGSWAFPGGHLEFNETPEQCAIRETEEETGLILDNIVQVEFTNDIFEKENKHYITLFVLAKEFKGDVKIMEPNKCEKWEWFSWDDLPNPLFLTIENLIKKGFDPRKVLE